MDPVQGPDPVRFGLYSGGLEALAGLDSQVRPLPGPTGQAGPWGEGWCGGQGLVRYSAVMALGTRKKYNIFHFFLTPLIWGL